MLRKNISEKLKKLPTTPGVYFHKNDRGEIIYIGKAANLRSRVRHYFQKSRMRDPKTDALVSEIFDIDWIGLETEVDALFLEAELVRRYQPNYNILLRDDKSQLYVRIDYKSDYPTVTFIRRPLDDGAEYFGPYINSAAVKRALKYLRRAFPYAIHKQSTKKRVSLYYHIGLDPGLEEGRTSLKQYRANLKKLMQYLRGQRVAIISSLEKDMKMAAKAENYEQAAKIRNQLSALNSLNSQILFGDKEIQDLGKDKSIAELTKLLNLNNTPKRIEAFDISHMQGSDTVASMVVFSNGVPFKTAYRKFKMRLPGNNDAGHIHETISRRLNEKNLAKWGSPDLIMIDGGKGQLTAGLDARNACKMDMIPMIGLAKREEEIIVHKTQSIHGSAFNAIRQEAIKLNALINESDNFILISLPHNKAVLKLLQRIRDESHRFAVSYHSSLKRKRQTASLLDEIPGIGPATRKKLIKHFGSTSAVFSANENQLSLVLGNQKGKTLARYLKSYKV